MGSSRVVSVLAALSVGLLASSLSFVGCAGTDSACLDSTGEALVNVCPKSGTLVKGVDVSKWQATIDWTKVKGAGYDFAFIRASDGLNYPDGMFQANWQGAKAAGVIRGVYQFFRPSRDPIAQAGKMQAAGTPAARRRRLRAVAAVPAVARAPAAVGRATAEPAAAAMAPARAAAAAAGPRAPACVNGGSGGLAPAGGC